MTVEFPDPRNEFQAATIADDQADDALDAGQQQQLDAAAARVAELEAEAAADDQRDVEQQATIDRLEALVEQLVADDDEPDGPPDQPPAPPKAPPAMLCHVENPTGTEVLKRVTAGWAQGHFRYWLDDLTATLEKLGPRPLQISPKASTPQQLADVFAEMSPAQRLLTTFTHKQEMNRKIFTTDARRQFRAEQAERFAVAHQYGVRRGVHLEAWTLNPGNKNEGAGRQAFVEMLPDDRATLDRLCITCMDWYGNKNAASQMGPVMDVMAAECDPRTELAVTSIAWTVPAGTPADSPARAKRADATRDALQVFLGLGSVEFGWFDFTNWEGVKDSGVAADPLLNAVMVDFAAQLAAR